MKKKIIILAAVIAAAVIVTVCIVNNVNSAPPEVIRQTEKQTEISAPAEKEDSENTSGDEIYLGEESATVTEAIDSASAGSAKNPVNEPAKAEKKTDDKDQNLSGSEDDTEIVYDGPDLDENELPIIR